MTRELIDSEIVTRFGDGPLRGLPDAAVVSVGGNQVVFTTDSFVVSPNEFPGGNVGDLAVHGSVNDIAASLRAEFRTLEYAKADFPMLTTWGVPDFSHTIHSLGCNYPSALGRHLGFWAISDYPVRVPRSGNTD